MMNEHKVKRKPEHHVVSDEEKAARKEHETSAQQVGMLATLEKGVLMDAMHNDPVIAESVQTIGERLRVMAEKVIEEAMEAPEAIAESVTESPPTEETPSETISESQEEPSEPPLGIISDVPTDVDIDTAYDIEDGDKVTYENHTVIIEKEPEEEVTIEDIKKKLLAGEKLTPEETIRLLQEM